MKQPGQVDMVIFRENTEDVYAGIEWPAGSPEAQKLIGFLSERDGVKKIRFPRPAASASSRSRARAPSGSCAPRSSYALSTARKSVTLVHKGNIMKFTEGAFRDWGYELARREFRERIVTEDELGTTAAASRRGPSPGEGPHRRHDVPAGPDCGPTSSA